MERLRHRDTLRREILSLGADGRLVGGACLESCDLAEDCDWLFLERDEESCWRQ